MKKTTDTSANITKVDKYSLLKDVRLEFDCSDGTFSLCFWLFLVDSTPLPATILRQVYPEISSLVPFLVLNEKKRLVVSPLLHIHKEAPSPENSTTGAEVPFASTTDELALKKWVHIGCEVSPDFVRLHIDGELAGEMHLSSSMNEYSESDEINRVSLTSIDGNDDVLQSYIYDMEVLPLSSSIKNHYSKDPPVQLSIDGSSSSEIEEDTDGVWSIVGGKASCRRNFSLDVVLLNALHQPVNKEVEVVASLIYDDNGMPVEKPYDAEAPLLTTYDGIEFASFDRPSKLINGRASFKLKISQLSSKCDNRLFRIRFDIPKRGSFPFLEAISHQIRCISRNRNSRSSSLPGKKPTSAINLVTASPSSLLEDGPAGILHNIFPEAKPSLSSKRVKLGQEDYFATHRADVTLEQADEECNSRAWTANEDENAYGTSLEERQENNEETDNSQSDSESTEARHSVFRSIPSDRNPVSDFTVFKYCLGGLTERSLLLKEIAISASEQELVDFAQQVAVYTGCSHHRHQIMIAKRLIEEGTNAWNMISQNSHHVLWETVVSEIKDFFMKITCSSTRTLSLQDFELLRRIAGCQEFVAQEHFEKMWCWLYPVYFTLSKDWIQVMWNSESPKWIEGFITKEEAESSLQGPGGLQEPGTFVLRFPTSRSWPHPDAGCLVVTYVSSDYTVHNRLLSLDFIYSFSTADMSLKPLPNMLLDEPELSHLGRVTRSH